MPPKIHLSDSLLTMAKAIHSLEDGEYLSVLLNRLYSGDKDVGHKLFLRPAPDGSVLLGKRGDVKVTVPLTDVNAVHHFMTSVMGISSGPGQGTICLGGESAAAAAPTPKTVEPKQITAKMYFKNAAGFESYIKDTLNRLKLTPDEAKKVHAALLPSIFMVTNIRICLDHRGEVVGILGMNRNGVQDPKYSIMLPQATAAPAIEDDF